MDSRRNVTSYRLPPYDDRCKQVGLQRLESRRTVVDAVLAYDIYKGNINDELISSKFVRNVSEYEMRCSNLRLLIEPRLPSEYLLNQPVIRLIKLINEFKSVVASCDSKVDFRNRIIEDYGGDNKFKFKFWCYHHFGAGRLCRLILLDCRVFGGVHTHYFLLINN